jgi:hypothetical protein
MKLPQIQIYSTPGKIGIHSELGQFDIRQQDASIHVETTDPVLEVHAPPPEVIIDMSRTWDALTGGKPTQFWNRIYNQFGQFVQHAIENTVSEYNRIGDVTSGENAVAAVAWDHLFAERPKLQIYGEASVHNISFEAHITRPEINFKRGRTEVRVTPHKPEIEYHRGNVEIYMAQYPKVKVVPPKLDVYK